MTDQTTPTGSSARDVIAQTLSSIHDSDRPDEWFGETDAILADLHGAGVVLLAPADVDELVACLRTSGLAMGERWITRLRGEE